MTTLKNSGRTADLRLAALSCAAAFFGCRVVPAPSPERMSAPAAALEEISSAPDASPATAPAPASTRAVAGRERTSGETALCELLAGMGVRYLPDKRRIEVSGWVNMQTGLVEVFACAPEGKTHESVVVLDCVPSGVHAGLLALGLQPGTPVEIGTDGEYKRPTGDRVEIRVSWKDRDGAERTARAEEWIWDQKTNEPMQPAAWIFAGSFMQKMAADAASSTYAANYVKSLVTTYHDASSVLENPWADGIDDTVYYSNERAVPPVGTPVSVIFSPEP